MKNIFVNAAFVISLLFFSACGFQLNRNQAQLIDGAKSISVTSVENNSFIPSLDIALKSKLLQKLSAKSIPIKSGTRGDFLIEISINNITSSRSKYSLVDGVQTYLHTFTATGALKISQNPKWAALQNRPLSKKKQKTYPVTKPLTATYGVKSTDEDLSQTDIDDYRGDVLEALCSSVISQLSVTF